MQKKVMCHIPALMNHFADEAVPKISKHQCSDFIKEKSMYGSISVDRSLRRCVISASGIKSTHWDPNQMAIILQITFWNEVLERMLTQN